MTHSKTGAYIGLIMSFLAAASRPAGAANEAFIPNIKPSLEVPRISTPIKIDGELDDQGWRNGLSSRKEATCSA